MTRKILSLLLTITLLATSFAFPVSAATTPTVGVHSADTFSDSVKATEFVTGEEQNFKSLGRVNPAEPLLIAWHTAGVEFDVTGTSVVGVRLKDYSNTNDQYEIFLNVTIDGEPCPTDGSDYTETYDYNSANANWLKEHPQDPRNCFVVPDGGAENDYIFATNLDPNETYTVKVTMNMENWGQYKYYAFWAVSALTDNSDSAKVSKTADAENKILVLGDSITSAKNIGGVHNSYHQLTAQAFNADTQVISATGAIFTRNYLHKNSEGNYVINATDSVMANKMAIFQDWNQTAWDDRWQFIPELCDANNDGVVDTYSTKADPHFTPELIIVNIGTNDTNAFLKDTTTTPTAYSSEGSTVGEYNKAVFKRDFTAFLDEVRDIYNNPKIILCYGMMTRLPDIVSFYENVVNEYNSANSTEDVYAYFFDDFDVSKAGKLNDSHPDKYAHATAAELLIAEVEDVMGWTVQTGESDTPSGEKTAKTYFYPEYPEYTADGELILPRDYDYEVYVNDGVKDTPIPVYNATRSINSYVARGGKTDSHRRFSEFSFYGKVTVKIKVKGEMSSYAVLPSNSIPASSTSYDSATSTISVTLTEPKNFVVRLNDDYDTILSIFAEKLWKEEEVPTGNDVITYTAGYHDVAKDEGGQLVIEGNKTVYLYPGAIVNARVKTEAKTAGSNITLCGRGSFIDPRTSGETSPSDNRVDNEMSGTIYGDSMATYMFSSSNGSDNTVKGVKFLDAHTFNICFSYESNFLVEDVKILSSEISTDGITTYGDNAYGTVKNCFIYNNDNVFVMSGGSASNGGIKFENNIVGSGYGIVYPQGPIPYMTFDGLDVFRMNDFYRSTVDSSKTDTRTISIKNVRAEDASVAEDTASSRKLIYIKSQDTAVKNITFENVALPADVKNLYSQDSTETGFSFTFKDVFIGGTKLTSKSQLTFEGSYTQSTVNDPENTSSVTINTVCPNGRFTNAKKVASHTADPVIIIGKGLTTPYYKVSYDKREDGTVYVPVAYILKKAGYTVKVENNGAKVTASDDNTTVVLTETSASNTTLTDTPELVDGVLMAPTSLMFEVYGLKVGINADGNLLVSANGYDNLLKDGGFENLKETSAFNNTHKYATSFDWSHFYHGWYFYDTNNVYEGDYSVKVRAYGSDYRGISQNIADVVKTYGAGTYTFTAYVKFHDSCSSSTSIRYGLGQPSYTSSLTGNQTTDLAYTTDCTKISKTITITADDVARADLLQIFVLASDSSATRDDPVYFYVDDACLTFTPTEASTQTADIVPYIATADRTIYYEYDGTNAVINTAKTPSGITVKVGDRLDIRDVLMQKYPNIDLNRVTLKTTYTSNTWYQPPAVEEIYAAETGTLTVSISQYFDVSGTKKTVSDTLLTVTVSSSTAPSNLSTYSYSQLKDTNAIIHGRVADTAPNQFYWQGSGAEFKFTGTTVGLKVTTKSTQKIIYQIDGGKEQTLVVAGVNASNVGYTYILAEGLENKEHTVKFLRSYESFWGAATIAAVTPYQKWPSKPASTSELKVQFIGDSITSGSGLENYTYDYAYLTAKQLNADFQAFSISGAVMSDFMLDNSTRKSANKTPVIPYIYGDSVKYEQTKLKYYEFDEENYTGTLVSGTSSENVFVPSSTTYDMTRFTPDIVVINLGTNDVAGITNSKSEHNKEVFTNMYANFLMTLEGYYPDAKFVLSYGMMGFNQEAYDCIEEAVDLYRTKGGLNPTKVLKYTNSTDKAYDNSHPGILGHATAANELVAAINSEFDEPGAIICTADADGNITLPEVVAPEGKLIKGLYYKNGDLFKVGTPVEAYSTIKLYAKYIDADEALSGTVNPDGVAYTTYGDSLIPSSEKYLNSLYYQGIQVRMTENTGLRFIFARGFELEEAIKEEIPDTTFEVKYLVSLTSTLGNKELNVDNAKVNEKVVNIFRTSPELTPADKEAEGYEKFTVCITGLRVKEYLYTDISVRPYITYTDASGQPHILYGEQAECSIYDGAEAVYAETTNKSDKKWLYDNILSLIIGDNDVTAGEIFD